MGRQQPHRRERVEPQDLVWPLLQILAVVATIVGGVLTILGKLGVL